MRWSAVLLTAAAALIAPTAAGATATATTVRLPTLPELAAAARFGLTTPQTVVIWGRPVHRHRDAIWRLAGHRWRRVAAGIEQTPQVRRGGVIVACPFRSIDGGRTFKRYRHTPCAAGGPAASGKTVVVAGTTYHLEPDLNALLVKAPGASGFTPTAPAFAWDPDAVYPETAADLAVFASPLRVVLFRRQKGSRGTSASTPFRSIDGGATWQAGPSMPGDSYISDTFGGGRLYTADTFDGALAAPPIAVYHSSDLGATWHELIVEPGHFHGTRVIQGDTPGELAIYGGRRLWVTEDGGITATAVADVPRDTVRAFTQVIATPHRFGDWLLVHGRTMKRVTLTG